MPDGGKLAETESSDARAARLLSWREVLAPYQAKEVALFTPAFMEERGDEPWHPTADDGHAAAKLHTQLVSRITTQPLGYTGGVEAVALKSVFELFQRTRDIVDQLPECRHFDAFAWDVLNARVRPFTAKWHRASEQGALNALDATDEFRAELAGLQLVLRRFDELLVHLRDGQPPKRAPDRASERVQQIADEMRAPVAWGIPKIGGGVDEETAKAINEAERAVIDARRSYYSAPEPDHAVALALSGGGIRSATFSLGVLIALASRGVLTRIDYLSTVSGGGYLGSFLSAFLNSPHEHNIGLRRNELPFRREEGEAAALRHLRHHSKYLATGSFWHRFTMTSAQLLGMVLNGLAVVYFAVVAVAIERWIRGLSLLDGTLSPILLYMSGLVAVGALFALALARWSARLRDRADKVVAWPAAVLVALLVWRGLDVLHAWFAGVDPPRVLWTGWSRETWLAILGAIPVVTAALAGLVGGLRKRVGVILLALSAVAAPLFLLGIYLVIYRWAGRDVALAVGDASVTRLQLLWTIVVLGGIAYLTLLDVNFTSPHRHYRQALAKAYLFQAPASTAEAPANQSEADSFTGGASVLLSSLDKPSRARAPYHLINCALNVPGSKNEAMQGRLTDFFLFSPKYCGSPLIGYFDTKSWEKADAHLDLATAMAISGAAAAPQMGLATRPTLRFWLALLNIRLGYWLRRPDKKTWLLGGAPGLRYLLKEMLGRMDECRPWINVTDGGHIENLGIYELLRRRCKYIIAIDGEQDPRMTFHGLTTLQRLAAIDFGIQIDIDLDDLRLNEQGLSRSHFRFCRIRYPKEGRDSEPIFGYLLYMKLSLTGNEGEFLRRYRLDEPAFPHHSTADQFFSEAQFEAYRSLGEHIGDKLFLRAIVGDLADSRDVSVEEWFRKLGESLLEPRPHA